jgi:hypothetical protein
MWSGSDGAQRGHAGAVVVAHHSRVQMQRRSPTLLREQFACGTGSGLTHPTHQSPGLDALQAGAEAFSLQCLDQAAPRSLSTVCPYHAYVVRQMLRGRPAGKQDVDRGSTDARLAAHARERIAGAMIG